MIYVAVLFGDNSIDVTSTICVQIRHIHSWNLTIHSTLKMADSQHPEVVSKLKAMGKETKTEEKEIQHALKDIHSTEKADVKASKVRRCARRYPCFL